MHDRCGINGRTVSLCRLELNLTRCRDRGLIESMSQAADYTIDVQLPIGAKHNFQKHFTFQIQLARLIGVQRFGLENNFHRQTGGAVINRVMPGITRNLLGRETGGLDSLSITAAIALSRLSDSIAEP